MSNPKAEAAILGFEKCQRLLSNADFQWFLEEALGKPVAAAQARLEDLSTSRDARENAAHVLDALKHAHTFVERRSATYQRDLPAPQK